MYRCARNLKLNQGFLGLFMWDDVCFSRTLVPSVSGLKWLSQKTESKTLLAERQEEEEEEGSRAGFSTCASWSHQTCSGKHKGDWQFRRTHFPYAVLLQKYYLVNCFFSLLLLLHVRCTLWALRWFSLTTTAEHGCHKPNSRKKSLH